jgi:hypothetical protein
MIADELNSDLSQLAEMPATNMPKEYRSLKQAGEAVLAAGIVFGVAYAGNKAIDYFKNNTESVLVEDPNKDIAWEYQDN